MFLWHFPSSCPDRTLSCTTPYEARTFLPSAFGLPKAVLSLSKGGRPAYSASCSITQRLPDGDATLRGRPDRRLTVWPPPRSTNRIRIGRWKANSHAKHSESRTKSRAIPAWPTCTIGNAEVCFRVGVRRSTKPNACRNKLAALGKTNAAISFIYSRKGGFHVHTTPPARRCHVNAHKQHQQRKRTRVHRRSAAQRKGPRGIRRVLHVPAEGSRSLPLGKSGEPVTVAPNR